jgi:hypothetical protein
MDDAGIFVVVTIAPNGVIHAWGEGPVEDPKGEEVVPFVYRADARRMADRLRRDDQAHRPGDDPLVVKVCKVMGTTPVPVD